MADLNVDSRAGGTQPGKHTPRFAFARALLVRLALGGFNGWFAYYVFEASNWGAFWFAFGIGFIISRFDVLPRWEPAARIVENSADSSS